MVNNRNLPLDEGALLDYLLSRFRITPEALREHRMFYNNHFDEYENDIYADVKTRLVHLQNYWEGNLWFNKRYDLFREVYRDFDQIIELGFSLPYMQLEAARRGELLHSPRFVFVDLYQSAIDVTQAILEYLGVVNVEMIKADIQDTSDWQSITKGIIPGKRLFVAIETVEHLSEPDKFWANLKGFKGDHVILSLPIGPAIPSHFLVTETADKARDYVGQHVELMKEQIIAPDAARNEGLDDYKVWIGYGKIR